MIDAHIHLDHYDSHNLYDEIERWHEAGITGVIAVSKDLPSSYQTLALQQRFPDFVHACIGFHPEYPLPGARDFAEWRRLLQAERARITAIGEIGLPHYELANLPDRLEDHLAFVSQILDEAVAHGLPVALHAVHDKAALMLQLLQTKGIAEAHFHWLKAPPAVVRQIAAAGYYISLTPEVCYRQRDQQLARLVPARQLLIETDGPWRYDGPFSGQETTPLFLQSVVQQLAALFGTAESTIRVQIIRNTHSCYRLEPRFTS
ncbi:TatD family hydrolase [Alkalihalobacillus oceani]|uniref:TatD family hydrolase n=1 Tax=Halalkalibacter oceani TaxID=1653776 RepID=A0A9X2DRB5_9BACI|nr:TatD family hydrolase [Halalkalibacter oceani]MCM3714750.1 TatD family hydrolase [Halalkalibacter oceani]